MEDSLFIHPAVSRDELIRATIRQLDKDLGANGYDLGVEVSAAPAGPVLRGLLTGIARQLLARPHDLYRVLYAMAVPQQKAEEAIALGAPELAELMLRRAVEKVLWRKLNSGG